MREYFKRIPGLRRVVRLARGQAARTPREYLLSRMPRGSICAEIGVHKGDFSEAILRSVKVRKLHLIDPWRHEEDRQYEQAHYGKLGSAGLSSMDLRFDAVRKRFRREIGSGRIALHRALSADVADQFEDGYFDWVYIDGNHLYTHVKQDLELYYPKVKPGGYLAGDDYGVEGWWENGVQKAVDEFVSRHPDVSLEVIGVQFVIRR